MSKKCHVTAAMVLAMLASLELQAQSWSLPQGATLKDEGPRTYRFTVEYFMANTRGEITSRQRLTGEYTRALPNGQVAWKNVSQAKADSATAPFGPPERREFMEGFHYRRSAKESADSMAPEFFKGFPPTAVYERNLVWDTEMIEDFGQKHFDELKLNRPYHMIASQTINLPDVGKFQNRDVQLEWVGKSQRNGKECAVIGYSAFFNPLEIANGGADLKGRSHYWGQMWVSLTTRQIEFATLNEDVMGELKLPGQNAPLIINVFRHGTFEPMTPE